MAGLSFNATTRVLSGTPTTVGSYGMAYTARDADGDIATLRFTITVAGSGSFAPADEQAFNSLVVGNRLHFTCRSGIEGRENWSVSAIGTCEPLGVLTISTHGQGSLVTGSVKVVSDGPIGGMLRFDLPGIGETVVGPSSPVRNALFPVRRQEGGITTGVALHNLESSPGLLRCDLMREGVLLDAASIPLEANGQTSWLIDQAFPAADTSDFAGSVRCDAVGEGLFSAVALEMDPGNRIFATLPVVPVPEMPDRE